MAKKKNKSPADQAKSPINGVVPPAEKRWKPGQSGNPKGRPTAGASIREWWNVMQNWPLERVENVLKDVTAPVNKIMAARAVVDACSRLRSSAGQPIAGNDLDRIIDYTAGKPTQAVEVSGPDKGPIETKKRVDYDAIENEIREVAIAVATRVPADDR